MVTEEKKEWKPNHKDNKFHSISTKVEGVPEQQKYITFF